MVRFGRRVVKKRHGRRKGFEIAGFSVEVNRRSSITGSRTVEGSGRPRRRVRAGSLWARSIVVMEDRAIRLVHGGRSRVGEAVGGTGSG